MWMPTHVQVTVQRASGLLTKGKHNTNDCFVTIALGKVKYQTSVKEKADPLSVEWHEECELAIPDQGNKAEIILTVLHRNIVADEFLGRAVIPLNTLDIYERPKNRWYTLQSKVGQENKSKERGKLEVKIGFTVKSGSLTDLRKKEKHKSSLGQLSHVAQSVGGSLLSLGSTEKRKGLKKVARSIGTKLHVRGKKKDNEGDDNSSLGSVGSLQRNSFSNTPEKFASHHTQREADPGVISEDEDEFTFDDLSHKSSASSLSQNVNQSKLSITSSESDAVQKNSSNPISKLFKNEKKPDEWESKIFKRQSPKINGSPNFKLNKDKSGSLERMKASSLERIKNSPVERVIIGREHETVNHNHNSTVPHDLLQKFEGKTREDLILMVCNLQRDVEGQKKKVKDLEDYLDELLLRVMETTPRILQNPYISSRSYHLNLKW